METTKLSSKGQVIIPKTIRDAHHWSPGLELMVIDTGEGILLKPHSPFPETKLEDVAGMLYRKGQKYMSDKDIEEALTKSIRKEWGLDSD